MRIELVFRIIKTMPLAIKHPRILKPASFFTARESEFFKQIGLRGIYSLANGGF